MQISKIYEICNAYESGVGHGNNRDGLSAGPYSDPDLNEAYEYGYQQGEETAVIDATKGGGKEGVEVCRLMRFMERNVIAQFSRTGFLDVLPDWFWAAVFDLFTHE